MPRIRDSSGTDCRYMERWMNINMHDSTEVSAKKHDKQNEHWYSHRYIERRIDINNDYWYRSMMHACMHETPREASTPSQAT
jgi:frataxin-like iron-binding protein CyaY